MTPTDDDRDLRDRFAELRRDDERLAPAFRLRAGRFGGQVAPPSLRRGKRFRAPALAGFTLLLAVAFYVGRYVGDRAPHDGSVPHPSLGSIGTWRSPTDFLLETPGRQLLKTVPAVGRWPSGARQSSLRPAAGRPL